MNFIEGFFDISLLSHLSILKTWSGAVLIFNIFWCPYLGKNTIPFYILKMKLLMVVQNCLKWDLNLLSNLQMFRYDVRGGS